MEAPWVEEFRSEDPETVAHALVQIGAAFHWGRQVSIPVIYRGARPGFQEKVVSLSVKFVNYLGAQGGVRV